MVYVALLFGIFGLVAYVEQSALKKRIQRLEQALAGMNGTAYAEERKSVAQMVQSCLGKLDRADRDLLALYFANELSLQETAHKLYLHKNTLQYRLNRIRARSGLDPRRFRDACAMYTALCLERISGAAPRDSESGAEQEQTRGGAGLEP